MHVERGLMIAVAEQALYMKADGREQWRIFWLEWLWEQEIEGAVWSIKQAWGRGPRPAFSPLFSQSRA